MTLPAKPPAQGYVVVNYNTSLALVQTSQRQGYVVVKSRSISRLAMPGGYLYYRAVKTHTRITRNSEIIGDIER